MSLSRVLPGDTQENPLVLNANGHLVQTGLLSFIVIVLRAQNFQVIHTITLSSRMLLLLSPLLLSRVRFVAWASEGLELIPHRSPTAPVSGDYRGSPVLNNPARVVSSTRRHENTRRASRRH
jgi:hypothetical protein